MNTILSIVDSTVIVYDTIQVPVQDLSEATLIEYYQNLVEDSRTTMIWLVTILLTLLTLLAGLIVLRYEQIVGKIAKNKAKKFVEGYFKSEQGTKMMNSILEDSSQLILDHAKYLFDVPIKNLQEEQVLQGTTSFDSLSHMADVIFNLENVSSLSKIKLFLSGVNNSLTIVSEKHLKQNLKNFSSFIENVKSKKELIVLEDTLKMYEKLESGIKEQDEIRKEFLRKNNHIFKQFYYSIDKQKEKAT